MVSCAIELQRKTPLFLLVTKTIRLIWKERNDVVFRSNQSTTPNLVLWSKVLVLIEALKLRVDNAKTSKLLRSEANVIYSFLDTPLI